MLIVDRFESEIAVCETEGLSFEHIPLSLIDGPCKEGDVLIERGGRYYVDEEKTTARSSLMRKKLNSLFNRSRDENAGRRS